MIQSAEQQKPHTYRQVSSKTSIAPCNLPASYQLTMVSHAVEAAEVAHMIVAPIEGLMAVAGETMTISQEEATVTLLCETEEMTEEAAIASEFNL